ncbi:MAG: single-stranded DNA-binding protein [Betaproteobacteria bacterium]|nr:single-stranded DNA-binding protein [Betaproteobacteria bacterium]
MLTAVPKANPARLLAQSAAQLSNQLAAMRDQIPVTAVYDPSRYARQPFENFLQLCASGPRRFLMLGMNPGPWGMAQTGVPFGTVSWVRDWMGITGEIGQPEEMIASRPVSGWACAREEVSGSRLWGMLDELYGSAERLFAEVAVFNYCPLLFLQTIDHRTRNVTPDRLPKDIAGQIGSACDEHLAQAIELLDPQLLIGVGAYAHSRLQQVAPDRRSGKILHPSPASPAANRGFREQALGQLQDLNMGPASTVAAE